MLIVDFDCLVVILWLRILEMLLYFFSLNFHSVVFHCIQEAVGLGLGKRVNKE